jgi:hypothetical protein
VQQKYHSVWKEIALSYPNRPFLTWNSPGWPGKQGRCLTHQTLLEQELDLWVQQSHLTNWYLYQILLLEVYNAMESWTQS